MNQQHSLGSATCVGESKQWKLTETIAAFGSSTFPSCFAIPVINFLHSYNIRRGIPTRNCCRSQLNWYRCDKMRYFEFSKLFRTSQIRFNTKYALQKLLSMSSIRLLALIKSQARLVTQCSHQNSTYLSRPRLRFVPEIRQSASCI